jgi:hypothetical protein
MAGVDAEVVVVTHLFSPERASLLSFKQQAGVRLPAAPEEVTG